MWQALYRRFISPPYWVLYYRITGRRGEYDVAEGHVVLTADGNDREAAESEAVWVLQELDPEGLGGQGSYTVRRVPWYSRIRGWRP